MGEDLAHRVADLERRVERLEEEVEPDDSPASLDDKVEALQRKIGGDSGLQDQIKELEESLKSNGGRI